MHFFLDFIWGLFFLFPKNWNVTTINSFLVPGEKKTHERQELKNSDLLRLDAFNNFYNFYLL